jgi:hypothetical protein
MTDREFKLLCRAYFAAKSIAYFSEYPSAAAEAVLKEAEFEKRILSELERFTLEDVEELSFKD